MSERPLELTKAMVAGTWRNEQRDGTLEFSIDGTYRARNFPPDELLQMTSVLTPSFDRTRDHIDGQGEWKLDTFEPMHPNSRVTDVWIYLGPSEFMTREVSLRLEGHWYGDRLGLALYVDDPDLNIRYVYLKSENASLLPSTGLSPS